MEIWPGQPVPLGATCDGSGTSFSVFSEVAELVELCLFDAEGRETRLPLPERTAHCFHGYVPGVGPGQRYGYRVHGPYAPEHGQRCNPHKLLLDPYARAVEGALRYGPSLYGFAGGNPDGLADTTDSADSVPRSLVIDSAFDWGDDRPPATPWTDTVIYELHVKGFSARHPGIPPELRGTYAGLAHPAAIEHLKRLGVTAVELLPVHHFASEPELVARGLSNYWGYNSLGFFAPHAGYRSTPQPGGQVQELKQLVRSMHAAGLEVILDVVYNHTAEGGHGGPTLCFRGFDNAAYYRLNPYDRRRYVDYTGCGNTLNTRHPYVLQLIMDSLRYWVEHMHVDGFRFDLASALAREEHAVDRGSGFFDLIQQDPVLRRVKLIAEPWDVGEGGYQVGNFPSPWSEWNGRYRDSVRDFWRGSSGSLGEFAYRVTGSSDLYAPGARTPQASINYVTSHDGFTLRDLVSYSYKHNLDNGEDNRDGESDNRSLSFGVEGPTDDPAVLRLRARQQRNFLATLALSQGVPMLTAGDELGRTQRGNNNAYCQDNELSFIDWAAADEELVAFVSELLRFRSAHPVLRRRSFFQGRAVDDSELDDIGWFRPDGQGMRESDWAGVAVRSLGVFLNGQGIRSRDRFGKPVQGSSFFVMFNADSQALRFTVPQALGKLFWRHVFDTVRGFTHSKTLIAVASDVHVFARSLRVLEAVEPRPLPAAPGSEG